MTDRPDVAGALSALEADRGVVVVAARAAGSRAWGLAGPDSDYDVRLLYLTPDAADYALGTAPETIADARGRVELDGWDVARFADLVVESNPSALAFLRSSPRYRHHPALDRLAGVVDRFRPIDLYHQYRSLATHQYRKYLERRLLDGDDPVYRVLEERPDAYVVEPVGDRETDGRSGADDGTSDGDDAGGNASADGDAADGDATDGPEATTRTDPDAGDDGQTRRTVDRPTDLRATTVDRTVKRCLYCLRAALSARYVRETHWFPPVAFDDLLTELADRSLADEATLAVARELARRKRAGEGDAPVDPVPFGPAVAVPDERISPEAHAVRGIDRARVERFVRAVFADPRASD